MFSMLWCSKYFLPAAQLALFAQRSSCSQLTDSMEVYQTLATLNDVLILSVCYLLPNSSLRTRKWSVFLTPMCTKTCRNPSPLCAFTKKSQNPRCRRSVICQYIMNLFIHYSDSHTHTTDLFVTMEPCMEHNVLFITPDSVPFFRPTKLAVEHK